MSQFTLHFLIYFIYFKFFTLLVLLHTINENTMNNSFLEILVFVSNYALTSLLFLALFEITRNIDEIIGCRKSMDLLLCTCE